MLAVDSDHLRHAEEPTEGDVEPDLFGDFAPDCILDAFQKIDLAAGQIPVTGLEAAAPALDKLYQAVAKDRRAAADARSFAQEAIAAKMRAQERAPL